MTIERSHGKARPTLPRSDDLRLVPTGTEARRSRDERGRLLSGNDLARGRGWKQALRKMLGKGATDVEAIAVSDDAWRLFVGALHEMPHDGQNVRALLMRKARHEAMSAYWSAKASLVGLATEEGIAAEELATQHGQRAERLTVTALDVATKLAGAKQPKPLDLAAVSAAAEAETARRRDAAARALPTVAVPSTPAPEEVTS